MERLIVDGYNIIFAWPELSALKDVNLQDARELLIATLA
ncbi:MAG TPA: NYN domain-containing protein, partial [Candidatus Angelobacter sp.]|nr:NYN domain-containing protein [Candidatus Angelobacter sp.]